MAKKKTSDKPNEASVWLQKIGRAKQVKDNWKDRFRVQLAYEYYEGNQRPTHVPESEWITVNKLYSDMQAELPNLYAQDPEFYVKVKNCYSQNPMDVAYSDMKAEVRQAALNYYKDERNLKPNARLAIFDAFFQFGIIKTTYKASWLDNPDKGKPDEPERLLESETYNIDRIHPDDFLVDEDATPLYFCWCAHRIKARLEDVQKDKRFNASARQKVKATEVSDAEKAREKRKKGSVMESGKEPEPDIVVYYEIWDTENKKMLVVSDGCNDEFLMDPSEYPKGIEEHPFEDLRYTLRDDSWYPYPPLSPKLDPQREISETRSKILTHRKRFNRKYEAFSGGFDDADVELAKLELGEDGTIIRTMQPQQIIRPIQDAPLDMQVMTELTFLNRDFQEYGASSNQLGSGQGIDSATEAGIIEKRFAIREGDRQSQVADFLGEIGRKLDQLIQANLTTPLAVKIRGPQGMQWREVRPEDYQDIYGEYSYGVVVGSHTPQLPEIERAQALNFLSLVAQAPQIAMSPALMRWLGKLFKIHENDLNLMIQELQQVFMQMQQAQMMQKGVGSMPGTPEISRVQSALPGMALGMSNVRGGLGNAGSA